jgi:hypothetical protein
MTKKSVPKSKTPLHTRARRRGAANGAGKQQHAALDNALRYAKEGIRAIWIPRGRKGPIEDGWPELATTDPKIIRQWAADHPGCNFGLNGQRVHRYRRR